MTPFSALLMASGLSQREAADLLGVREDSVKSWCNLRGGRARAQAPAGVVRQMAALVARQQQAAREMAALLTEFNAGSGTQQLRRVELGLATDDAEAASLGWPTVRCQLTMLGHVLAQLDPEVAARVVIVPRGTTAATAAAADQTDLAG